MRAGRDNTSAAAKRDVPGLRTEVWRAPGESVGGEQRWNAPAEMRKSTVNRPGKHFQRRLRWHMYVRGPREGPKSRKGTSPGCEPVRSCELGLLGFLGPHVLPQAPPAGQRAGRGEVARGGVRGGAPTLRWEWRSVGVRGVRHVCTVVWEATGKWTSSESNTVKINDVNVNKQGRTSVNFFYPMGQ